jgi:sulfite reductase (NADPH) hemoprotein beta-component
MIGHKINDFVPVEDLLSYTEAVLRVYNLLGRRDNKYKARIKILLKETGLAAFTAKVEEEWEQIREDLVLDNAEIDRVKAHFTAPAYEALPPELPRAVAQQTESDPAFAAWFRHNTFAHKVPGYRVVFLSLKPPKVPPGDLDHRQMDAIAELADRYSFGEIRVTHNQNMIFAGVRSSELHTLWAELREWGVATPNINKATDIICCPGLDFCSLANASSIPIAEEIYSRLDDFDYLNDLGDLRINISGCMNGCGHHTVGHIGILGVDKKGEEWYQLTLGGSSANEASLGERLGPAIAKQDVADAVTTILKTYVDLRGADESFLQTVRRIGITPFQEQVYGHH